MLKSTVSATVSVVVVDDDVDGVKHPPHDCVHRASINSEFASHSDGVRLAHAAHIVASYVSAHTAIVPRPCASCGIDAGGPSQTQSCDPSHSVVSSVLDHISQTPLLNT